MPKYHSLEVEITMDPILSKPVSQMNSWEQSQLFARFSSIFLEWKDRKDEFIAKMIAFEEMEEIPHHTCRHCGFVSFSVEESQSHYDRKHDNPADGEGPFWIPG